MFLTKISYFFSQIHNFIKSRVEQFGAQYVALGIFGIFNYPLSYFMWHDIKPQTYESLTLRLIAGVLCIPLALKNYWPKHLVNFLPAYWYLTILYCLPFFGSYMLLKNHLSTDWLMNAVLGILLLVLIVDWLSFTLLLSMGMGMAWIVYNITEPNTFYNIAHDNISLAINMYLFVIIIVAFFSHRKFYNHKEKLKGMMAVGASIAHELRTPLASIDAGITGAKKYFPKFITAYEMAKKANLPVPPIRPDHYEKLLTILDDLSAETHYANTIIDMLLIKVQQSKIATTEGETHSITGCIATALDRYPFEDNEQLKKVHWEIKEDFLFKGNEILIIHILFNLIKNSLYFINDAQKGEIFIWSTIGEKFNKLFFKDTAKGISSKIKMRLFDKFYTNTPNGTGLGLYFCRMVMLGLGGHITCRSEEGEYIEFIMSFPKVQNN